MSKAIKVSIDEKLRKKSNTFSNRIKSDMYFKGEVSGESISFEWLDIIEEACPYLDNVIRNPRVALITEEEIVKIEKAKKVSVASVKNLAKNTQYIDKIDKVTEDVQPSRLLIERREETYNTYENRFLFTVVKLLIRFVADKEESLKELIMKKDKVMEYAAVTNTDTERVNIKLNISTSEIPKEVMADAYENEINNVKNRLKEINAYFSMWQRSDFMTSLEKARVTPVSPPIRKTNLILKNPNFQMATKLWEFLRNYEDEEKDETKVDLETTGNKMLKGILDDMFLTNYFVLDSIKADKSAEKEKLTKYAVLMLTQQVRRAIQLLIDSGVEISDEEIISMISAEIKADEGKTTADSSDVKRKFKKAVDDYIEKMQDYL